MDFPLSRLWFDHFYPELVECLHYSEEADSRARDELSALLRRKGIVGFDWRELQRRIKNSTVFVFGAGPSVSADVEALYPLIRKPSFPVVAADGAIDALAQTMVFPLACLSDLDSASEEMLVAQSEKRALFVHAHGDNIRLLKSIVPKLSGGVFGTTQVASLSNVQNVGGFTDGDRSCYFVAAFEPRRIVVAGMNFGVSEANYSSSRKEAKETPRKERKIKMEIGRRSLEFFIANSPKIEFLNTTKKGEEIRGATRISGADLVRELS